MSKLLVTHRKLAPVCWAIPGVGVIAGTELIAVGPRPLAPTPHCPNCELDIIAGIVAGS
jgi:hypothetical protein